MILNIRHNLGLGDHIVVAPIVASLARNNDKIRVACYPHNMESVKSLFINYPNVEVVQDNVNLEWNYNLGFYNPIAKRNDESFVDWFYRQSAELNKGKRIYIDYSYIYKAVDKISQFPIPKEDYIFLHEDLERGFKIDRSKLPEMRIVVPTKAKSILSYANLLMGAKEVHVIDSSFLHLAGALKIDKVIYHSYARYGSEKNYKLNKNWIML